MRHNTNNYGTYPKSFGGINDIDVTLINISMPYRVWGYKPKAKNFYNKLFYNHANVCGRAYKRTVL